MTYLEQFEAELVKKLQGSEDLASIVRWAYGKILESYRNGLSAGQKGKQSTPAVRKGQSDGGYSGRGQSGHKPTGRGENGRWQNGRRNSTAEGQ